MTNSVMSSVSKPLLDLDGTDDRLIVNRLPSKLEKKSRHPRRRLFTQTSHRKTGQLARIPAVRCFCACLKFTLCNPRTLHSCACLFHRVSLLALRKWTQRFLYLSSLDAWAASSPAASQQMKEEKLLRALLGLSSSHLLGFRRGSAIGCIPKTLRGEQ